VETSARDTKADIAKRLPILVESLNGPLPVSRPIAAAPRA